MENVVTLLTLVTVVVIQQSVSAFFGAMSGIYVSVRECVFKFNMSQSGLIMCRRVETLPTINPVCGTLLVTMHLKLFVFRMKRVFLSGAILDDVLSCLHCYTCSKCCHGGRISFVTVTAIIAANTWHAFLAGYCFRHMLWCLGS